jgi:hypothetical protein
MAHFAKIGLNSKVIEVLSVNNEVLKDANGIEQESNWCRFLNQTYRLSMYGNKLHIMETLEKIMLE